MVGNASVEYFSRKLIECAALAYVFVFTVVLHFAFLNILVRPFLC
jgi:hypothetical protein